MSFRVSLTGQKDFKRAAQNITKEMDEGIRQALLEGAFKIQREAKISIQNSPPDPDTGRSKPGNAPKTDTGRLVNSILVEERDDAVVVGSNVKYSEYLEFGTRYMAARPFMQPALEKSRKSIIARLIEAGNRAVSKGVSKK